jgi:hypothetical protein
MNTSFKARVGLSCKAMLVLSSIVFSAFAESGIVRLEQTEGVYQLTRNGQPYFIRGAGGSEHLDMLVDCGGNSIRTWSSDGVGVLLDDAHKLGISVTVGFWLGHERHGFKYHDKALVAKQLEKCREAVRRYKDHPALLMWAVGNEMEGDGKKVAIWKAVEEIAAMCKQEDPNHPTMTVTAELGVDQINVKMLHKHCPSIDIMGINSYAGLPSVRKRYAMAGGTKPYIITEFGPKGHWEVKKADWGAPIEQNSSDKAEHYRTSYLATIDNNPLCLGGYAFIWGNKMEVTETWFSMILRGGHKTKSVDVMTELWSGKPPENRCPDISDVTLDRNSGLKPGDTVTATLTATDPDGDALEVKWRLMFDSGHKPVGGDFQEDEPDYPGALLSSSNQRAVFKIPESGGGYRIMAYAFDRNGNVASANAPLNVEGKVIPKKPPESPMPFVIYNEADGPQPYIPSGYMGNHSAIEMDEAWQDNPYKGRTCLKVHYGAPDRWGGVVWQTPANDWGDLPGGFNLSKATKLTFAARGEKGGEKLGFGVGVIRDNMPYPDSSITKLNGVVLTQEWKEYTIELDEKDLSLIKSGFMWSGPAKGQPFTFYLDEICFTDTE